MRLLAAVRLSRDSDSTTSPERQRELIAAYAKANGHKVIHIAEDVDVSGAVAPADRPELGPWLAEPGKWDAVIVSKLDRLTRSILDFAELVKTLESAGKSLICLDPVLDMTTPAGRAMAQIVVVFAEFERAMIRQRTREGYAKLRQQARWGGGQVPFGLTIVRRDGGGWTYAHDPVYAPVVKQMAAKILAGSSMNQVAAWLNETAVPTSRNVVRRRSGKPENGDSRWTVTAVRNVLTGPAATGTVRRSKGEPLHDGDSNPVELCTPILTATELAQIHRAITGTKHAAHRVDANPLLRVAFCGHCSAPLYTTSPGRNQAYYRCRDHAQHRARSIPAGLLEEAARELFLEQCGHLDVLERVDALPRDYQAELEMWHAKIADLDAEYERIDTALTAESYGKMHARFDAQLAALTTLASEQSAEPEYRTTGVSLAQSWATSDAANRRKLMADSGFRVKANRDADGSVFVMSLAGPELAGRVEAALKGTVANVPFPATAGDLGMPLRGVLYTDMPRIDAGKLPAEAVGIDYKTLQHYTANLLREAAGVVSQPSVS